ncbi:MAG: hypothetical protein CMF59_05665 [Leptospiraceae bacterium]|nr:hypothetical protein [Leptospiraceae bacterium]
MDVRIRIMSENPYLRSIRIFDPAVDLSEDKRKKPARNVEMGGDLFEELQQGPAAQPAVGNPATNPPQQNSQSGSSASSDGLEVVEDESMEIIDL